MAKSTTHCNKCGTLVTSDEASYVDKFYGLMHDSKFLCSKAKARAAQAPTVRSSYAAQYRSAAPRGTCKGCGGPVADGRSYCGEC